MYRIEWSDGSVSPGIGTLDAAKARALEAPASRLGAASFEWEDAALDTVVTGFWSSEQALASSERPYALVREEREDDELSRYEAIFAAFLEDAKTADTMPPPAETMPPVEAE